MATPMDVFERVIHLSDNGDENTGQYDIQDNQEYKYRLLSIINTIYNELYPYSDTCVRSDGKRPVLAPITSLTEEIDLDNYCVEVMVYGVGARMFTGEDAALASFYEQEYERRLHWLEAGGGLANGSDAIEDVYSGYSIDSDTGELIYHTGFYPHNHFGRW